jgi:hypothetical protein
MFLLYFNCDRILHMDLVTSTSASEISNTDQMNLLCQCPGDE